MGYYTKYNLEVEHIIGEPTFVDSYGVIESLRNENEEAAYALEEDGECSDSCKWYDHEHDLKEFSKTWPEFLFKLEGEGEDSGDVWKKYFKDGRVYIVQGKIVFDEPDMDYLLGR